MYAETIATRNTVGSDLRALAQSGRPQIDIILNDQRGTYISTYTTLDTIEGEVVIRTSRDARFDRLHIDLQGMLKIIAYSTRHHDLDDSTTPVTRSYRGSDKLKWMDRLLRDIYRWDDSG